MTTHLSVRIAGQDSSRNGVVCRQSSCNTSCIVHDYIRDARDDAVEDANAGRPFPEPLDYLPPCSFEAATYAPIGYAVVHRDPVEGRGLPSCYDRAEAHSASTTPYRWMRDENFADI